MMQLSAIIVDDEEIARLRLHKMISENTSLNIRGEAENGIEALDKIDTINPDIVFLDIQMPGLNGFEVLSKLKTNPIIIFTTAFDEYAIKAFEENAVGYLLKPIHVEKLISAVNKAEKILEHGNNETYSKLLDYIKPKKITQFISKLGSKIRFIPIDDVCYISSKDKNTFIHLFSGVTHIVDQTLQELDESLDSNFIRIHRSYILFHPAITEAEKMGEGKYLFTLSDQKNSQIQSSSSYTKAIKERLNF